MVARWRGSDRNAGRGADSRPYAMRLSIRSVLQVCAATVIGVTVILGISAWVHLVRPTMTYTARISPPRMPRGDILPGTTETVGSAQPRRNEPPPAAHNGLPIPLPVKYGVYAGSNGQLTELEPLPVEVPARARGCPPRSAGRARRSCRATSSRSWCSGKTSSATSLRRSRRGSSGGSRGPSPSSISRRR